MAVAPRQLHEVVLVQKQLRASFERWGLVSALKTNQQCEFLISPSKLVYICIERAPVFEQASKPANSTISMLGARRQISRVAHTTALARRQLSRPAHTTALATTPQLNGVPRIAVFGVGGAGGNTVNSMIERGGFPSHIHFVRSCIPTRAEATSHQQCRGASRWRAIPTPKPSSIR